MKKTKIICTLGPASSSEEIIRELFLNGMNVGRFNFSHGTHEEHLLKMKTFRKVRDELDLPGAILLDTKGPEIRLRNFINDRVVLVSGKKFILTSKDVLGTDEIASITYSDLPNEVKMNTKILIDDGKVELIVESTDKENIYTKVLVGGSISNHKGVNVPSIKLGMPYLNNVDKDDLLFGIEQDEIGRASCRERV